MAKMSELKEELQKALARVEKVEQDFSRLFNESVALHTAVQAVVALVGSDKVQAKILELMKERQVAQDEQVVANTLKMVQAGQIRLVEAAATADHVLTGIEVDSRTQIPAVFRVRPADMEPTIGAQYVGKKAGEEFEVKIGDLRFNSKVDAVYEIIPQPRMAQTAELVN